MTPSAQQAQAHFAMSALMNVFPPAQVPAETLSGFFDKYADRFDEHLRDGLEYRVPEQIAGVIKSCWDSKPMDILDMGCGTGLCGPLLRPMARSLTGVDLSSAMIAKAAERGVYDRLAVGDMIEFLRSSPMGFDLLVSTDVLIYVGDLSPTFEAAVMAPAARRNAGIFRRGRAGTAVRLGSEKPAIHAFGPLPASSGFNLRIRGTVFCRDRDSQARRSAGQRVSGDLGVGHAITGGFGI